MIWWGNIPKLTHAHHDEWKDNVILILLVMRAYAIVTGEDHEQPPRDFDLNHNYGDWNDKEAEAVSTIRISCTLQVWCNVKGIRNLNETFNTLEISLDTAGSYISRQDLLPQFRTC